ncbi:BTB/POZ domain-containing protein 6-like [Uloborus diversus]|uniref:BTB/POZ domain-containing protein 6-like n=1 Tax=Uloborus diversus TaxID=327109 RepID=UPI00240A63F4|nr:BTB/POZ domain-containing protein 6-like [Uloborus diversus]
MSGTRKSGDWRSKCGSITERWITARKKGYFTDVTFLVGPSETKFMAHRNILACGSPVFEAMFYGSLPEWKEPILFPDVDQDAFSILLSYIYGESVTFKDISTSFKTCAVAEKYLVPELKAEAEKFISNIEIKDDTVWKVLKEAIQLDVGSIKNKCYDYIARKAEDLLFAKEFMDTGADVVDCIVKMESLNISEFQLLLAIAQWGKANSRSTGSAKVLIMPYLSQLSFKDISISEFCAFTDKFPGLIENSDALTIIKHLLEPTVYKLPTWCSKRERNRCLTPPKKPVDFSYYAFYSS